MSESGSEASVVGATSTTSDLLAAVELADATDVLLLGGDRLEEIYPAPLDQLERQLIGVYHRCSLPTRSLAFSAVAKSPNPICRAAPTPCRHRLRLKRLLDVTLLLVALPMIMLVVGFAALYVLSRQGQASSIARSGSGAAGRSSRSSSSAR